MPTNESLDIPARLAAMQERAARVDAFILQAAQIFGNYRPTGAIQFGVKEALLGAQDRARVDPHAAVEAFIGRAGDLAENYRPTGAITFGASAGSRRDPG